MKIDNGEVVLDLEVLERNLQDRTNIKVLENYIEIIQKEIDKIEELKRYKKLISDRLEELKEKDKEGK